MIRRIHAFVRKTKGGDSEARKSAAHLLDNFISVNSVTDNKSYRVLVTCYSPFYRTAIERVVLLQAAQAKKCNGKEEKKARESFSSVAHIAGYDNLNKNSELMQLRLQFGRMWRRCCEYVGKICHFVLEFVAQARN